MANKNFIVKNGLEVGGQEVVSSSGVVTSAALGGQTLSSTDSPTFANLTVSNDLAVSGDLNLTGDLNITGDVNSLSVTDLDVTDQTITLGAGQVESASGGSGIIVDGSNASILWDETNDEWDFNKGINVTGTITFDGGTTSANLYFGDNNKAIFGDGSDLQIYHNGSNSFIDEIGTGRLYIRAEDNLTFSNANTSKTYANFENGGASKLYHDNALSIFTTTEGAEIREALTIGSSNNDLGTTAGDQLTPLTLRSDTNNADFLLFTTKRLADGTNWTTAAHRIQRKVDATKMGYVQFGSNSTDLITFGESETEYMRIDGSGNVGIGTISPDTIMEIRDADPVLTIRDSSTGIADANATLRLAESGASDSLGNHFDIAMNNQALIFAYSGDGSAASEKMRFDAINNRFSIGNTSTLNANLHIGSASATGNATNPALQIGGASTYRLGMFTTAEGGVIDNANGDDGLQFHTKNAGEAVRITADGNLQMIGQTSSFASPGFTYHTNNYLYCRGGSAGLILSDDSGINTVQIIDGSAGYINFETGNGSSRMRIDSSGNVGIGNTPQTIYPTFDSLQIGPNKSAILGRSENNLFGTTSNAYINSSGSWTYVNNGLAAMTEMINGEHHWFTASSGTAGNAITFQRRMSILSSGNVGIGTNSPESELQVLGTVSSGTSTKPTHATYDSNGDMMSFEHVFSALKGTAPGTATNKTLVDISSLNNFHQAIIIVEYGTRLQQVSDSTTGFVHRVYALNRFNGGTLNVTETNAIAGSSNSLAHALIDVEIVSNTQYRIRVEFSSSIGQSSFASGKIRGYAVSDLFPTISFAEGTGN